MPFIPIFSERKAIPVTYDAQLSEDRYAYLPQYPRSTHVFNKYAFRTIRQSLYREERMSEALSLEPLPPTDPRPPETSASDDLFLDVDSPFISNLPPADGGRKAWLFLAGATVIEALVWGIPFSIGVLHVYWANVLFKGHESTVTLAATLQTGLSYISAGVFGP